MLARCKLVVFVASAAEVYGTIGWNLFKNIKGSDCGDTKDDREYAHACS